MIRRIILLLVLIAAVWYHGHTHGVNAERLIWQQENQQAIENARTTERQQQEKVNHAIQKQFDDLAAVHGNLIADLERLRDRPRRGDMPKATGVDCQGGTGRELSREDAGFLTREAARADELRAALIGCYEYADSLQSEQ